MCCKIVFSETCGIVICMITKSCCDLPVISDYYNQIQRMHDFLSAEAIVDNSQVSDEGLPWGESRYSEEAANIINIWGYDLP